MTAFCGGSPLRVCPASSSAFNNAIYLLRTAKRRELHKAIINKSGYSDMLWPLFAAGRRCGCDPLQVPPLITLYIF